VRAAPLLGIAIAATAILCAQIASRRSDAQPVENAQLEPAHPQQEPGAAMPDPGATLPNEPTKVLVLAYCDHCHGLEWIERSGANLDGWTDRIKRMNRAGAMIPEEQIAPLAEYLSRALPERPRPPEPPKKRERRSSRH
jgi:cytochrome c553